ncbi:MAG: hypothetical protein ACE5JL_09945 [Dehalococcoidia bacterium]
MDQREWFILGSKLVGVYCLALAVPTIITHTSGVFIPANLPEDMAQSYRIYAFLLILTPLLLALFGFYLIKSGAILHELAYPGGRSRELDAEGLFTIGIKVYGVYLLAGSMVEGLKILSSYIFVSGAPAYMDTGQEWYDLQIRLLPTIGSAVLAMFFLVWGQSLARLAVAGAGKNEVL